MIIETTLTRTPSGAMAWKFPTRPSWAPNGFYTMDSFVAHNCLRENAQNKPTELRVALGSDHGGLALKQESLAFLRDQLGIQNIIDLGTTDEQSVDYPDFAWKVGLSVLKLEAHFGLLFCGTGIGISVAANKIPGIIAANCRDEKDAEMARLHNAANILAFGGRKGLSSDEIQKMIRVFLTTKFEGGRHSQRVEKLLFPQIEI